MSAVLYRLFFTYAAVVCFFASLSAELFNPIAVYLTWQKNPDTTMTIHWITHLDRPSDEINFQKKEDKNWAVATGTHQSMPNGYPFYIHCAEISNLNPATDYYFRTGTDGVIFKFRTMPSNLDAPIRFIVGGDVYHDDIGSVSEINRQAAKTDPDFALLGGDLAYSISHVSFLQKLIYKESPERWLTWLVAWKNQMVTTDGRLIPMIPAIGNHEVLGDEGQTPEQAKFFYALFSMPGKQGYNVLDFHDYMSIFVLDSGHTHPVNGEQTRWLNNVLMLRQKVPHKFALYHQGAYPSVRSPEGKTPRAIRRNWVPFFERYRLSAAFEHHDHAYKRTYLLKNDRIDPNGVLYMGDGSWGISDCRVPRRQKYIARSASTRHFILVTLDQKSRRYNAIGPRGNMIDEFIQNIEPFESKEERPFSLLRRSYD